MTASSVRTLGLLAATVSVAAIALFLAAGSADAMQNNGGGALDPVCMYVDAGRYLCVFDGVLGSYICPTNHPKGPEECYWRKINTNRYPIGPKGGTQKTQ